MQWKIIVNQYSDLIRIRLSALKSNESKYGVCETGALSLNLVGCIYGVTAEKA